MGWKLRRTDAVAWRGSAGILLVLTQEGPAGLEFQEGAKSRRYRNHRIDGLEFPRN